MGIFCRKRGEKGNIATVLFGAVAMVGIVSAATMQMIAGPIKTASQVNNKNLVESQLQVGARLIVINAGTADDDIDGTIEPVEHDGVNIGLTGGGGIPSSTGASLTDPWNSPYGYCVWDNGSDITIDAGENRLAGDNAGSTLAIALISAGPNRVFETDCFAYGTPPNEGVVKPAGSDDYIFKYTYAEASQTGGGLWSIGSVNPADDVVVKDSGGTETIKVDKELGIGTFMGIVTPLIIGNGGAGNDELEIDADGGVDFSVSDLRGVNSATFEKIDGDPPFILNVDNHIWSQNGSDIYYNDGNVGIGTSGPSTNLHVVKNQNAATTIRVQNTTTGSDASASFSLKSDQTGFFGMNLLSSGYTALPHMANNAMIHAGSGIAGLSLSTDGYFRIFTNGVSTTATERLRIDTAGNVGIGTTTPDNKLHLNGADGAAVNLQFTNADTGEASASVGFRLGLCSTEDACLVNATAGKDMVFYTEGTEKMVIQADGDLGVGETTPLTRLHVSNTNSISSFTGSARGSITSNITYVADNYNAIDFTHNGGLPVARIASRHSGSGTTLVFGTSSNYASGITNEGLMITNVGNVTTAANLYVNGGYIYSGTKEAIRFTTADSYLRLNQSGDFGDGVYTPYNLRVDGAVYLNADRNIDTPTGNYGTIQVNGTGTGGYAGYSIDGNFVFMSNGTNTGIYDDINNKWIMYGITGSYTYLYNDGTWRVRTTTSGIEVNNTLAFASDLRLKKNVKTVDHALDKLSQINGVSFNWKDKEKYTADKQLGVIAQDVQKVFPELVLNSEDEEGNDYLTVNYNGLVAPMIESIKELKAENEALKARLDSLEASIKTNIMEKK